MDTLTFALTGQVALADFARATRAFLDLATALGNAEAGPGQIKWVVESLESGSTLLTTRGITSNEGGMSRTVRAYGRVARAVKHGGRIAEIAGPEAERAVQEMASVISGDTRSLRFEAEDEDYEIFAPITSEPTFALSPNEIPPSLGAVEGRVQTISNTSSKGYRFTIYDSVSGKAVSCYASPELEHKMRESWGKLALVVGMVRRDPMTGRPTTIRSIVDIVHVPDRPPRGYLDARGCAPPSDGTSAEDAIRRIRDAS